ncbi:hypothetical protein [Flammeovirga sp. SJP92]|uniref:hypothetical protein n=1 Tax=Flammeovirga sp. SJP92 TaxID=1775430 RepID=UPI000789568F|nr:hypothetical protein [Flammeovirga sp. SJP92]KXX69277.1 hypothetical protein AVL50_19865 [Flammeovirga sp. SJP92]
MNTKLSKWISTTIVGMSLLSTASYAQNTITVKPTIQRYLGESTSKLDRDKYMQAHIWFGDKEDKEFEAFKRAYNINPEYKGSRRFWSPLSTVKAGKRPKVKNRYKGVREVTPFSVSTGRATTFFYDRSVDYSEMDVTEYSKDLAAYLAERFKKDWQEMPAIYEPYNEPMVHAKDLYPGKGQKDKSNKAIIKVSESLREIGRAIHAVPELQNMKVAGYASAWPAFEVNDFDVWDTRYRSFIDIAGKDMDILSVHLYDGKGLNNSGGRRSGSNAEAILDLIEAYSYISIGEVKPIAITEYGRLVDDQPGWTAKNGKSNYHPIENSQAVRSQMHMAMAFMERGDNLVCAIPFSTSKQSPTKKFAKAGLWTKGESGEWELTSRKYFFEVLKDVKGNRVHIGSDNVDIQTQAFVDGKQLYVILNNLNEETETLNLAIDETKGLKNVKIKRIKTYVNQLPELVNESSKKAPSTIDIAYGETIVLTYNFSKPLATKKIEYSTKYYASEYLKPIKANQANTFAFQDVVADGKGSAVLRLGVGRAHGKSLQPKVVVNGKEVTLPEDVIRGYDQHNRKQFFGLLEIPVPAEFLKSGDNIVSITFPDTNGRISSAVLKVIGFSKKSS